MEEEGPNGESYLEDRREYDQTLLRDFYKITDEQAYYLYELVQSEFRPGMGLYSLIPCTRFLEPRDEVERRLDAVCEVFGESMHDSFDGWDDGEKVLISLYLNDIAQAVELTYKSRYNQEVQSYLK